MRRLSTTSNVNADLGKLMLNTGYRIQDTGYGNADDRCSMLDARNSLSRIVFLLFTFYFLLPAANAQVLLTDTSKAATPAQTLNFSEAREYIVTSYKVVGLSYLDPDALMAVSGIKVGDAITLPGETISAAIRKLGAQGYVSDIAFNIAKTEGQKVWLELSVKERPRLSKFSFKGTKRGEANDLREKINLARGRVVTDAIVKNTQNIVRKFFVNKGFFNAKVRVSQRDDSTGKNTVSLIIDVDKGRKVKVETLEIMGNEAISDKVVRRRLKETKQRNPLRIFKASRYVATKFDSDKEGLIAYYNKQGHRDAAIISDSVYRISDNRVGIVLKVEEGPKYYFRNIAWTGNFLYPPKVLSDILGIRKGDVYNQEMLDRKLNYNPNGADVSSLYMDDGYLFFRVTPAEVNVEKDSIDIELRVYEGQQATINRISIEGNDKTSDHVILRELRTLPGEKFSREKLIRSNREIAQLGYFDPEQIGINPVPNQSNGTVDINYTVVEKPSDQVQLSGGWGGFFGFVGTLGLVFNNFSVRKIGKISEWKPLPSGDGQRMAINFQANGRTFQTYNASFTEPWLGGKRANSFTVGLSHSVQNSYVGTTNQVISGLNVSGFNVSLGRRLRFPDDYFTLSHTASLQRFNLFNYNTLELPVSNGTLNQISITNTLSRNSINNPVFPTSGSSFTLSVAATPPYSLVRSPEQNRAFGSNDFRFVEFHKWMFDGSWFTSLAKNLVLSTRAHFGFLGHYNKQVGIGPFERFKMGGSGIAGFNFLIGYDIIGLRGYQDNAIGPNGVGSAGIIYNKYVTELRYAISTNPSATIYGLVFAEGGNNWGRSRDFNPFNVYRSVGTGVRIMMPAFGLLGVDYGFGFDKPGTPFSKSGEFTFSIGQQIR